MQAIQLKKPGGLENFQLADLEPREPGPGEIRVRVEASSLNYHDFAVVSGAIHCPDGRIPMSDGAGYVDATGPGVQRFAKGDKVLSCFFPNWVDGRPELHRIIGVPGDHVDGFAAQYVTAPATAFTRCPQGWSSAQSATLPCAAVTA